MIELWIDIYHFVYTAPSSAPSYIEVTAVDYTTMKVRWNELACTEMNGPMKWWNVLIRRDSNVVAQLSAASYMTEITVPALQPLSEYSATVTAVNGKGWGPESTPGYTVTGQL